MKTEDDAAGRGISGGGEAKNLQVSGGVRVRRGSDNLGLERWWSDDLIGVGEGWNY
jgi:hypothetical protein